jgi:beta-lactamase class A
MQKDKKSWKFFLLKKVPIYILLILMGFFLGAFVFIYLNKNTAESEMKDTVNNVNITQSIHQIRQNEYQLIKPLLLTETSEESQHFQVLKENLLHFLDQKRHEGLIKSASVYLRQLDNGTWMSINKDELFSPGSIMKIPTLICILKDAEKNPLFLEKEIYFKKHFSQIPEQTITGEPLKEGNFYKVKDLIYYMIVYSDNDATALLNSNLNFETMKSLFYDLQLPVPDSKQQDYQIDVTDCSRFLRILFNATYLSKEMSQYALDLLTKSAYKNGITKDIDPSIKVAHKFGERNNNGEQQLHEFGIVYVGNSPYLLGVMTKGDNHLILPEILSGVSDLIFQSMKIEI